MEIVVSIIKYLNYMNRFIGEIFYTTCRNDPCFLEKEIVKLIATSRIYGCTGCILEFTDFVLVVYFLIVVDILI